MTDSPATTPAAHQTHPNPKSEASVSMTATHVSMGPRDAVEDYIQQTATTATPAATRGGLALPSTTAIANTVTGCGAIGAAVLPAGELVSATILHPPVEEVVAKEPTRRPVVVVLAQKVTGWL